jgi:hypothetical protein
MLRRIARALRLSLATLGFALLLWLPLSFYAAAWAGGPWLLNGIQITTYKGAVVVWVATKGYSLPRPLAGAIWKSGTDSTDPSAVFPSYRWPANQVGSAIIVTLPLWLLAAVCLAWPVTSFLLAAEAQGAGV